MAEHRGLDSGVLERLWESEPLRTALYPVVVIVIGMLVARGLLVESLVPIVLAAVAGALGIAGTEVARREAFSPATVQSIRGEWNEYAASEYARGVADAVHTTPDRIAAGTRQCGDVRGGRRCVHPAGHEGRHLIPSD